MQVIELVTIAALTATSTPERGIWSGPSPEYRRAVRVTASVSGSAWGLFGLSLGAPPLVAGLCGTGRDCAAGIIVPAVLAPAFLITAIYYTVKHHRLRKVPGNLRWCYPCERASLTPTGFVLRW